MHNARPGTFLFENEAAVLNPESVTLLKLGIVGHKQHDRPGDYEPLILPSDCETP